MTEKELVPYETLSLQDTERLGKILVQSTRFTGADSISKAVVQVLAGRELGFGPIASMTGIYVIKGKVSVGANMMAQAVKRSTKYDYRIAQMDTDACEIVYFEQGKEIGRSRFDKADAARAGTQNMGKFPRNMMFARAMSNGVKWYCPDVFQTGVYTPEELGVPVDGTGEIVEGAFKVEKPKSPPAKSEVIEPLEPKVNPGAFNPEQPDLPCNDWQGMFLAGVQTLGFNAVQHVKNALKSEMGEGAKGTISECWTALVKHQADKAVLS